MFKDKKITFLGDSITQGYMAEDPNNSYVNVFKKKTGAIVTNLGIGGTRFAYQKAPSLENLEYDKYFESRICDIPLDSDIIVVFGGTNDYGHGDAEFGSIDDETIYTFCGALNSIMNKLKIIFPKSLIVFCTPTRRMKEDMESLNDFGKPHHGSLKDYRDAIITISKKHNIPVIDLYTLYKIDPTKEEERDKYMKDGHHPNDIGHKMLADVFIENLSKLI